MELVGSWQGSLFSSRSMQNLKRALGFALVYRWTLLSSFICSLIVAVLWGANLGAVYPFVQIVLKNKTFHEWADDQILESERIQVEKQAQIDELQQLAVSERPVDYSLSVSRLKSDVETEQSRIGVTKRLQPWITSYAPSTPYMTLVCLMALMFGGTILRGLALMGNMVSVARIGQRTVLDIQDKAFTNVLRMDTSELDVKGTGDLINRVRGETNAIGTAVTTLFGKTIREPMKMVFCLSCAAYINWRLLLFSLLICPVAALLMVQLAKLTKRANRRAMEESAKLLNRLFQAVTYQRIVKAFTREREESERFKTVANDVYRRGMRIAFFNAAARMNNELLGVAMITISVLVGGYLVLSGSDTILNIKMSSGRMEFAEVMTFFGFLIGVADPLRKMGDVYNLLQSGVVAADRVFPLIDQRPAISDPESPKSMKAVACDIKVKDLRFAYEKDGVWVVDGVSFELAAGSSVAIVGHNGCGKSTLINLLPRFYERSEGSIRIGGHDIRDYAVRELRSQIGYVTQMTMLFSDTIEGNIAYGKPDATRAEVRRAAEKAHAIDFIEQLEDGFDTDIGEHGGKLSGGQRQRLSLARAILKDPKILLLDEATSQIDPESEQLIHQSLAEFIRGRTTIVVTHRLSTLDLVDNIMVMKEGKVIDFGTHEQLLARCNDYRRLRQIGLEEAA